MRVAIEILRPKDLQRLADGGLGDQHRAEHGFFGFEIVGRHPPRRGRVADGTDLSHQRETLNAGTDRNAVHTFSTGPRPVSPAARAPSPRRPPRRAQALPNTSSRPVGRLDTEGTAARNNRRDYREPANSVKKEKQVSCSLFDVCRKTARVRPARMSRIGATDPSSKHRFVLPNDGEILHDPRNEDLARPLGAFALTQKKYLPGSGVDSLAHDQ